MRREKKRGRRLRGCLEGAPPGATGLRVGWLTYGPWYLVRDHCGSCQSAIYGTKIGEGAAGAISAMNRLACKTAVTLLTEAGVIPAAIAAAIGIPCE